MKNASLEKNPKKIVRPNELEYDIYHTILLANYIEHWGVPQIKNTSLKEGEIPISVYCFTAPLNNSEIIYLATIGVAWQKKKNNQYQQQEFFITLPQSEKIRINEIISYLLDIVAHIINNCDYQKPPSVFHSSLSPSLWKTTSILVDEPLGEAENFTLLPELVQFKPEILWIIPIYDSECNYIKEYGIEKFDEIFHQKDIDLINPFRKNLI